MTDGALCALVPEVLVILTLLKALVPVIVPVAVWRATPSNVVVPESTKRTVPLLV